MKKIEIKANARGIVNRGYLMRLAAKGVLQARLDYSYDDMSGSDYGGGEWKDVALIERGGHHDAVAAGKFPLSDWDFDGHGHARLDERCPGSIVLHVHSNLSYELRVKPELAAVPMADKGLHEVRSAANEKAREDMMVEKVVASLAAKAEEEDARKAAIERAGVLVDKCEAALKEADDGVASAVAIQAAAVENLDKAREVLRELMGVRPALVAIAGGKS